MFRRLNHRWDNVPEPRRGLYFLSTAAVVVLLSSFEATKYIGGSLFVIATAWGISRF